MYEQLVLEGFVTINILQQIDNYIIAQERLEHSKQFQVCLAEIQIYMNIYIRIYMIYITSNNNNQINLII
jgi:hypothetical protein